MVSVTFIPGNSMQLKMALHQKRIVVMFIGFLIEYTMADLIGRIHVQSLTLGKANLVLNSVHVTNVIFSYLMERATYKTLSVGYPVLYYFMSANLLRHLI